MNKKVIYTCIVGNYTNLLDPLYVDSNCDYICFSNSISQKQNSIWQIRKIPYSNSDRTRMSRFVKLNPHKVLQEYDFSFWIDANIRIKGSFIQDKFSELILSDSNLSIIKHPIRNCTYDEAEICIADGRDKKSKINEQINFLRQEGFPRNFGLFENNLIFRKHKQKAIVELDDAWWQIYLQYTKRDQLSLPYLLWKMKLDCLPLMEKGISVRNHPDFEYIHHHQKIIQKIRMKKQMLLNKYF